MEYLFQMNPWKISEELQGFCLAILLGTCTCSEGKEETAYWSTAGTCDVVMFKWISPHCLQRQKGCTATSFLWEIKEVLSCYWGCSTLTPSCAFFSPIPETALWTWQEWIHSLVSARAVLLLLWVESLAQQWPLWLSAERKWRASKGLSKVWHQEKSPGHC